MCFPVTIGGDRLGSGNRMKVDLHGYERSTHNLGYIWRSTMSAGTLVPFLCEIGLPGDTFDIDLDVDVKTHPTVGPLFGSYKTQLDLFQIPMRLYNSLMHNNMLGIGMDMSQVKMPVFTLTAVPKLDETTDRNNYQINQSCILAYLGIRGVGRTATTATRDFNAMPLLGYWDIYKNYYANKQEGIGAVIHVSRPVIEETVTSVVVTINGDNYPLLPSTPTTPTPFFTVGTTIRVNYTGTRPPENT